MRRQLARQRKEIRDLQRAGISTKAAEELFWRKLSRWTGMCAERDRQRREQSVKPGTDKPIEGPSSDASGERLPPNRWIRLQSLSRLG